MCVICQEIGYTASPDQVKCYCGGPLKIIERRSIENENQKSQDDKKIRYQSLTHTWWRSVHWAQGFSEIA